MPKIMLAEDDPTMLSLLKTLMRLEGLETVTLNEQENILDAIQREKPDVILLDVHLTQGNGIDFLRDIRTKRLHDDIFIIMQSGMSLEDECKKAGANAFLLKPYVPDSLIQTIKTGIANKK